MCENWQSKRPKQIAEVGAAAATSAMGAILCMGTDAARGQEEKGHRAPYGVGKWQFIKSFEVSKISNCSQSAN